MPKTRKFGNTKTTTPEGKKEYQRLYMREYQRQKRAKFLITQKDLTDNCIRLYNENVRLKKLLGEL